MTPTHSDLSDRVSGGGTRDLRSSQFEIGSQTEANQGSCKQPQDPEGPVCHFLFGRGLVGGRVVLVARITYTLLDVPLG